MNSPYKEGIRYILVFALLILTFFGGTYILKVSLGTEYPMMVVVSQSMVPTLGVGDFILVSRAELAGIKAAPYPNGDIIVFLRPGSSDEYIVHRVISNEISNGRITYTTKGDNNAFPDGWDLPGSNIIGKVIEKIPITGYFSLFIKTVRGFGMVIGLMAFAFFTDYLMPNKRTHVGGILNPLSLIPLLIGLAGITSLWWYNKPPLVQIIESVVIIFWYIACLVIPLAFHDDDTGIMIWLYHTVLVMIPIACDTVWWSTGTITPSMWWYGSGSVAQLNWLLVKEQPAFNIVFDAVLRIIAPGVLIYALTLYAKRRGIQPFDEWSYNIRGAKKPELPISVEPDQLPEVTKPETSKSTQKDNQNYSSKKDGD